MDEQKPDAVTKLTGWLGQGFELYTKIKSTKETSQTPLDAKVNLGNEPVIEEKGLFGMSKTISNVLIISIVLIVAIALWRKIKK